MRDVGPVRTNRHASAVRTRKGSGIVSALPPQSLGTAHPGPPVQCMSPQGFPGRNPSPSHRSRCPSATPPRRPEQFRGGHLRNSRPAAADLASHSTLSRVRAPQPAQLQHGVPPLVGGPETVWPLGLWPLARARAREQLPDHQDRLARLPSRYPQTRGRGRLRNLRRLARAPCAELWTQVEPRVSAPQQRALSQQRAPQQRLLRQVRSRVRLREVEALRPGRRVPATGPALR